MAMSPMSTNPNGSPRVGGTNLIETSQVNRVFNDPEVFNWLDHPDDNAFHHGDRADFDWIGDDIKLESAEESALGISADNHPGSDFMVWEIGDIAPSSHPAKDANNGGHYHDTWGELALDKFEGEFFRSVDVVSQVTTYADSDVFGPTGAKSLSSKPRRG